METNGFISATGERHNATEGCLDGAVGSAVEFCSGSEGVVGLEYCSVDSDDDENNNTFATDRNEGRNGHAEPPSLLSVIIFCPVTNRLGSERKPAAGNPQLLLRQQRAKLDSFPGWRWRWDRKPPQHTHHIVLRPFAVEIPTARDGNCRSSPALSVAQSQRAVPASHAEADEAAVAGPAAAASMELPSKRSTTDDTLFLQERGPPFFIGNRFLNDSNIEGLF